MPCFKRSMMLPTPLAPSPMVGKGGNFFGAHSLAEVEPENHTVALLVGAGQATLQMFIDLIQEHFESDFFLAPMNLLPRLGVDIARGNVRLVTAG